MGILGLLSSPYSIATKPMPEQAEIVIMGLFVSILLAEKPWQFTEPRETKLSLS